jgi:hypothetical protein
MIASTIPRRATFTCPRPPRRYVVPQAVEVPDRDVVPEGTENNQAKDERGGDPRLEDLTCPR